MNNILHEGKYHSLTLLLIKVKMSVTLLSAIFYLIIKDSGAGIASFFNLIILSLLLLLLKKVFNLVRVFVSIMEILILALCIYIHSVYVTEDLPLSIYIILLIVILSHIFIPVIIFNYKTEKKYIIPLMIFSLLSLIFMTDYIKLISDIDIVELINPNLNELHWKLSIIFPFMGSLTTLIILIRRNSINEATLEKSNKELNSTIEQLKVTQQHLVQSEKMASLGTLTAGVAHEINNPLNFINGGLQVMSEMKEAMSIHFTEEMRSKCDIATKMMNSGFERTSEIVKALMSFSKRGEDELISTDINKIINNTLLFLETKIPEDIKVEKSFGLKENVLVYPDMLHQVFINIIDNAIVALRKKKDNKKIIISTDKKDDHVIIRIENNGEKISKENLSKIFDPFFTTKDPGEGIGLGLSICYSLIEEHKGTINVMNVDEGVCFEIEIPIKPD